MAERRASLSSTLSLDNSPGSMGRNAPLVSKALQEVVRLPRVRLSVACAMARSLVENCTPHAGQSASAPMNAATLLRLPWDSLAWLSRALSDLNRATVPAAAQATNVRAKD